MCENMITKERENEDIHFSPPLYRQRYMKVVNIIENISKGKFFKVVDIGSAEMGLFPYLKRINGLNEIVFLDIDETLLKNSYQRVNPLALDFLTKRDEALSVYIICGDAQNSHEILSNTDVVTMIEFIEHLDENILRNTIKNIFGGPFSPNSVIITTPNSDFNYSFPNLIAGQFRHFDHKFEWSEEQFKSWCSRIIETYADYSVTYDGCGFKDGICCSQIAIFSKKSVMYLSKEDDANYQELLPEYKKNLDCQNSKCCKITIGPVKTDSYSINHFSVIHEIHYPYDNRSCEQKLKDAIKASFGSLSLWMRKLLTSIAVDDNIYQSLHALSFPELKLLQDNLSSLALRYMETESLNKSSCEFFHTNLTTQFSGMDIHSSLCSNLSTIKEKDDNYLHVNNSNSDFSCNNQRVGLERDELSNTLKHDLKNLADMRGFDSVLKEDCGKMIHDFYLKLHAERMVDSSFHNFLHCPFNTFMYFEIDDSLVFAVETFCHWSSLPFNESVIRKIESTLKELDAEVKTISSTQFVFLRLYNYEAGEVSD